MKINQLDTYKTIQVLALAAMVVFFIFKIEWLIYVSLVLLILPLVLYKVAWAITWGWLKFAHILGSVNSRIILSIIFFVILTPLALLYQLLGRKIQVKGKGSSHFHERNHQYTPKDLEHTW
jgi:hypothetical protein